MITGLLASLDEMNMLKKTNIKDLRNRRKSLAGKKQDLDDESIGITSDE